MTAFLFSMHWWSTTGRVPVAGYEWGKVLLGAHIRPDETVLLGQVTILTLLYANLQSIILGYWKFLNASNHNNNNNTLQETYCPYTK